MTATDPLRSFKNCLIAELPSTFSPNDRLLGRVPMLMKFEKAAVILKPYRVKLILAMVIVLIGGFMAANNFDQNDAITIRTISMTLAWWLWLLFLIPAWFAPENRADIEGSMFPRLSGALRVYFMAFMILAFVFPIIGPLIAPFIIGLFN